MAPGFQFLRLITPPLACAFSLGLLLFGPVEIQAHQVSNLNGTPIAHNHVYRRSGYGGGLVSGHVAPTRHGHNMIIWMPAPSNSYGSSTQHMRIEKPNRHRLQQQRTPGANQQPRSLRQLDPRNPRR